jgi:HAD superfamily hydrolase (TIGR01490 family)
MKTAAFFDMDRTLIPANSGTLWIKFLRQRREISRYKAIRALAWVVQYKLAILDMEAITERVVADLRGDSEQEMIDKALQFTKDQILGTVTPRARAILDDHRRKGHVVAILSGATPYVTEPLAQHLGIDHVLCTRLGVAHGKFTGQHVKPSCTGVGKIYWAENFAQQHGIDLTSSYFYTDSYSDLPMLERVGERRVVNPDTRLLRHAKRVGWPVDLW